MFSKKYEYRDEDPGFRENIESVRQRMIANLAPAERPLRVDGEQPAGPALAEAGVPSSIELKSQSYASADKNLETAIHSCRRIAEHHRQPAFRPGRPDSFGGLVMRRLRWYTEPSDRYWRLVTNGLSHIVSSLKAHDAVLQMDADAVHASLQNYLRQAAQVRDGQAAKP